MHPLFPDQQVRKGEQQYGASMLRIESHFHLKWPSCLYLIAQPCMKEGWGGEDKLGGVGEVVEWGSERESTGVYERESIWVYDII